MARGEVIERDLGYAKILANMAELDRTYVDVGIHHDAGVGEDGMPIAEYAAYNEFGTSDGHVPERSFIRATFDEQVEKLNQTRGRLIRGVQDGKLDAQQAAGLLGEIHQRDIVRKIDSGVPPPNAPGTIRIKGSSKPLINEGNMKQAVRYEIKMYGRFALRTIMRNISRWSRRNSL